MYCNVNKLTRNDLHWHLEKGMVKAFHYLDKMILDVDNIALTLIFGK